MARVHFCWTDFCFVGWRDFWSRVKRIVAEEIFACWVEGYFSGKICACCWVETFLGGENFWWEDLCLLLGRDIFGWTDFCLLGGENFWWEDLCLLGGEICCWPCLPRQGYCV